MQISDRAALLRIYTDEEALVGDQALADVVVRRARDAGLAGATALTGRVGFGLGARLHQSRPFDLRENRPVVIEIVDDADKLEEFVLLLSDLHDIGLATLEKVQVLRAGTARA